MNMFKRNIIFLTMLAILMMIPAVSYADSDASYSYKITPLLEPFNQFFFVETDNPDKITTLTDAIRENLSEYSSNLPYELNMSIGVAKHRDGQAPKELIREADQLLYDVKEKKKS